MCVFVHYENGEFDREVVMIKEIYVIKEDETTPSQGDDANMGDEELINEDMLEEISVLIENIMVEKESIYNNMEFLEEWQIEKHSERFCTEDIGTIQEDFVKFYEGLNLLEERIESQRLYIHLVNTEFEKSALKNDEERNKKCDQWIGKRFITLMSEDEDKDNNKDQPRVEVDEIVEEMWMLMRQTSRRRYSR